LKKRQYRPTPLRDFLKTILSHNDLPLPYKKNKPIGERLVGCMSNFLLTDGCFQCEWFLFALLQI
jgi:hypothetical protein